MFLNIDLYKHTHLYIIITTTILNRYLKYQDPLADLSLLKLLYGENFEVNKKPYVLHIDSSEVRNITIFKIELKKMKNKNCFNCLC